MSRSTTTSGSASQTGKAAQTTPQQSAGGHTSVPTEKVAMRAYQKWLQSGCQHGCDKQHWLEAEAELRTEMSRGGATQKR